jgi:ADP-heptose:LPS heptosyltransferase
MFFDLSAYERLYHWGVIYEHIQNKAEIAILTSQGKGKEKRFKRRKSTVPNPIISIWQRGLKDFLSSMRKISQVVCGDSLVCLIFAMLALLGS